MDKNKTSLSDEIASILLERPQAFTINDDEFAIYPITLGKSFLISPLLQELNINEEILAINPYIEAMRLCHESRFNVCRLLAYHTLNERNQLFDGKLIAERARYFCKAMSDAEITKLLILVLTFGGISRIVEMSGMKEDAERRRKISQIKAKNSDNSITVGGCTIWGTLIDAVCQRYGWTLDYVLWGISLANMQLMMSDAINTIHLNDDEMKLARIPRGQVLNGDDPNVDVANILNEFFNDEQS